MTKKSLATILAITLTFTACFDKNPNTPNKSIDKIDTHNSYSNNNNQQYSDITIAKEEIITSQNQIELNIGNKLKRLSSEVGSIYFDFGKYDLKPSQEEKVINSANFLKETNINVKIEGNCDEWGTDEYNYGLGLKRAKSVKDALIAQGYERSRLSIISYGESNPACTTKSQECWSKNRRVDFSPVQ